MTDHGDSHNVCCSVLESMEYRLRTGFNLQHTKTIKGVTFVYTVGILKLKLFILL